MSFSVVQSVDSFVNVCAPLELVWAAVQNVDIANSPKNLLFNLLDIPKPISAELRGEGLGAKRVATFSNGKKFVQTVMEWNPPVSYSFDFEAEPNFRVGYFFDLSKNTFRILNGSYELLSPSKGAVCLCLKSQYEIKISLFRPIIRYLLKAYQFDLLQRIKAFCEALPDANA